ncbi:MAG: Phosphoheptose isomerase [Nitrosomonadaceae bacterium]|nr:Phosphoheptose isomerase [Nitrosomonadaceae bacterium]
MNPHMSLADRLIEFADLINRCEVTSKGRSELALEEGMAALCDRLSQLRKDGQNLYLIGNGGSAGVASHSVTDFFNVAKLRAATLHESSLMTCMANDFGYENAFARMVKQMMKVGDVVIAISSSGKSMNIRNAATEATNAGGYVVTLSGFAHDNPLRFLGDLNIWLDSSDYGLVEIGHQFLLHNISDRFGADLVS